ncbi:MAG: insulinase family protein [gamma proteobacterium symbiont of Bathyaustriella thionipta]|nr:insulinase family protein [gamma proteobacterium symbiont of Bathyaustriella thionipta]MCU7949482.1 insulinase family protein [gamma proteobacterium symbiont of Bathyaustriella thionipta]MCU7953570.1 insulinase family protein [gamma proteobacterium symbiont of Bathyaustriella thionipta]MCU7955926.1 insulinase family protein [gamma proteobacterium symbiont of Bathyaustriella thionipta]MCU7967719.1 insulinase family protein [gamma proteobacterium symbiont of Bathyaustriella thionipta]
MTSKTAQCHDAFEWIQSEQIESLDIIISHFKHKKTGALHYHIDADNDENVFLVALRTIPTDSTGVAHILEHTALCGSQKYPVRDPFFMMIRRSLNTFMNAFTSSDWTAYPFASQNKKDFNNLLDVYLDAVFFSRLDELDFAQEGHRLEFEQADDQTSELQFKGVVFNEMKGAMSSTVSALWQTVSKYLFPTVTYHFNSGGEPTDIPDLSYDQLKEFYRVHYHPSNAVFMTYGDIPAHIHQAKFEHQVLSRFEALDRTIDVNDEKRYFSPINIEESYPLDAEEDHHNKTHLVLGWLLGQSINLEEQLEAQFLSSLLLENSASPLMQALESTELGNSPSPLCGLEDSNKEMSFICGLEGSTPENAQAFEQLVINVLEEVAINGIKQDQIDAVLHQLELNQREIGGDHYPFGLQLILSGLSTAIHRGDVITHMNLDKALHSLRNKAQDPDYVKNLVSSQLLNNAHRIRVTFKPDDQLEKRRNDAEKTRLAEIKAKLSSHEKRMLIDLASQLSERQNQLETDVEEILPKVTVQDVPETIKIPEHFTQQYADLKISHFNKGTNGLVYQQLIIDMPQFTDEEIQYLPIFNYCFGELGCGDKDYLQMQVWQSQVSGGIHCGGSLRGDINNEQQVSGFYTVSGKALVRNHGEMTQLLKHTFQLMRFDETDRIKELVSQIRTRKENSITGSGHSLAMQAAASGMSPVAYLNHKNNGLASIAFLKELDNSLQSDSDNKVINHLTELLEGIHSKLNNAPAQFLLVSEEDVYQSCCDEILQNWNTTETQSSDTNEKLNLPAIKENIKQAWLTSTQVNFCAKAYATVPVGHEDAAPLTVLGGFLRNGFLHRCIREQGGAYGSGANQDSANTCFKFFSYRDPRLTETLSDFDKSFKWLLETTHDYQALEESILGVISNIDKPGSPAGDAKQTFQSNLFGRDAQQRQKFRQEILAVTIDDLIRVAKTYLIGHESSVAVVSNHEHETECTELGLELIALA